MIKKKKSNVLMTKKNSKKKSIYTRTSNILKKFFIAIFIIFFTNLLALFGIKYYDIPIFEQHQTKIEKKINKYYPPKKGKNEKKEEAHPAKKTKLELPGAKEQNTATPSGLQIPELKEKRTEQVIHHTGYTVSYNSSYRIANWVGYELTASEAQNKENERSNKFVPDPDVIGATAYNQDYTRTGYDRGHLAPAGDMKWSARAMRESFYLSNICPQKPGLNRGIWRELEEQCRVWAKEYGRLWIVTGPIIKGKVKYLGKNRVAIPQSFYKVIAYRNGNHYKGIGFIFENRDYPSGKIEKYALPIDKVESITGIDFYPSLDDKEEEAMEAKIDWDYWSF